VRLAVLPVEGVDPDDWTVAPLFVRDDEGLRPRPPGMVLADGLADADLAAFPSLWGRYAGADRPAALRWLDEAHAAGVPVVVWVEGDQEIDLEHPAAIVFEQGPSASRRVEVRALHAWPVLIHDHLRNLYGDEVAPRPWSPDPEVGFCGQATASLVGHARLLAAKLRDRLAHAAGRTDRLPAPLRSHLALRRRALTALERDERVVTDFVVRDQYRAGVRSLEERTDRTHPTATDFYENIRRTGYTVCVRGGGNFSTRLYETLCLGRIPIVVDDDGVLPWQGRVPWDELAVVVPSSEVAALPDRLLAFHGRLGADAFAEHQLRCRALWQDRLSVDGFFTHLPELLS
jgi:Exostosin family